VTTHADGGAPVLPALLRAARGAYSRAIHTQLVAAGFEDLPRNGPFVLGGMANRGGSAADLIRTLGVTKQAASQLVDTLVLRGYLERQVDADDRRRMVIGLTERGRAAAGAVRHGVEAVDAQLARRISPAELAGMRAGLLALAQIADRMQAADGGAGLALADDDPLAVAVTAALHAGDVAGVGRLLAEHPGLATGRVVSGGGRAGERTLLHVLADHPGHRPRAAELVALLRAAGADLDAPFVGAHAETALHWAASNDDVDLVDALLDAGANIEAPGAVIGGGTPLADATAFGQWQAADRLVRRGARTNLFQEAAMGLMDRLEARLAATPGPDAEALTHALWGACHGGRREAADALLARGADVNWVGWDEKTPVDVAERAGAGELAAWLRERGGRSATELR